MRVTIVGTGSMARGVAARALAGGHHVAFVGTALGKAEDLADELAGQGAVRAAEVAEGDLVVLAVPYTEAPHAVRQHAGELGGTVLVDVTNPVDLSVLEPLDVSPFRSGAEMIADVAPAASRRQGLQHGLRGHPGRRVGRRPPAGHLHRRRRRGRQGPRRPPGP